MNDLEQMLFDLSEVSREVEAAGAGVIAVTCLDQFWMGWSAAGRLARQVRRGLAEPATTRRPEDDLASKVIHRSWLELRDWQFGDPTPPGDRVRRTFAALAVGLAGRGMADGVIDDASNVVEAASIALVGEYPGEGPLIVALYEALQTHPWPRTRPTPEDIARCSSPFQVAWDAVADALDEPLTLGDLATCADRAERLGLDMTDPLQRAIAESATTPARGAVAERVLAESEYD